MSAGEEDNLMIPCQTLLLPDYVDCAELSWALRESLGHRENDAREIVDKRFREAMSDVIQGIQNHGQFDFLKRFIAHGSLLPSWESHFVNTPHALNDDELASFVDFVSGHMVTKFQGCLAEILSTTGLFSVVEKLKADGSASENATVVFGSAIRCLPRHEGRKIGRQREVSKGIQGPDGIVVSVEPENRLVIHAIIEIKSTYVSPCKVAAQFKSHLAALARGVKIGHEWFDANMVQMGSTGGRATSAVARIFVQPARWLLTRGFHFEPMENSGRRLVMQDQQLPVTGETCAKDEAHGWNVVTLAWSYDALRAAAFCLAHGYMAEVGEALARNPDPDVPLRTDMSSSKAGPNDLLHQLHVAIARQADMEPDAGRRKKAIELYNVLAFGWALGHGYRDADGVPDMMYPEDLDRLSQMAAPRAV
jgi:hypothetical protein